MDEAQYGRWLAFRSQTNVSADHHIGALCAMAAYSIGMRPVVAAIDPTLAGEAAAKAGLRLAQLDPNNPDIASWFNRSYDALNMDDPRHQRERIATGLLDGRTFSLIALRSSVPSIKAEREERASTAFCAAYSLAKTLRHGLLRDPYETMLSRHWATHESMRTEGSVVKASIIALRGITQALASRPKQTNFKSGTRASALKEHASFVVKQSTMNGAALVLGLTRPGKSIQRLNRARKRLADHMLC
ncbi:hypothetical protein IPL68_00060 [Candidatus Saccharibacteria bacterium]|nr:MAG: hypothetical protein IPL68_00060 [Candidatus Saccharibacteria bacterium]